MMKLTLIVKYNIPLKKYIWSPQVLYSGMGDGGETLPISNVSKIRKKMVTQMIRNF